MSRSFQKSRVRPNPEVQGPFLPSRLLQRTRMAIHCVTFTIRVLVSDGEADAAMAYPILLSEPVFGQVSGYAYYKNCTIPVADVTVTVDEKSTLTDLNGYFFLAGIPVDSYTLKSGLSLRCIEIESARPDSGRDLVVLKFLLIKETDYGNPNLFY